MTTSSNSNPLSNVDIGQIVQDLQTYQNDIANYCSKSAQQLKTAIDQLQTLSQTIASTMPALQQALAGLSVLSSSASGLSIDDTPANPIAAAAAPPAITASTPNQGTAPDDTNAGIATVAAAVNQTSTNVLPLTAPNAGVAGTDQTTANNQSNDSGSHVSAGSVQSVSDAVAAVSAQLAANPVVRSNQNNWSGE